MKKKPLTLFSVLWVKPYLTTGVIVGSFITTISNVELRSYSGKIVDCIMDGVKWENTLKWIALFFMIVVVFSFVNKYSIKRLLGKSSQSVFDELFKSVSKAEQNWLNKQDSGTAVTVFTSDVSGVENYVNRIISTAIPDVLLFFIAFIFIFNINVFLSIITVITSIIPVFIISKTSKILGSKYKNFQETSSKSNGILTKGLSNIELFKAYGEEERICNDYKEILSDVNHKNKKLCLMESIVSAPAMLTSFLTILATAAYGGWLVGTSHITIGNLFTVLMLTDYIIDPVMKISGTLSSIRRGKVNINRLNEYIMCPKETSGECIPKKDNTVIKMENVFFSYDKKINVLKNFNLEIKEEENVYIVGPIGSGKSSILKLITGILHPDRGRVLIYGEDIKECNLEYIRSLMSVVTQDIVLFNGTIYENLLMAKPKAKKEDIEEVCRLAGIHDEILSMQNGYMTLVGEGGYGLSGGQKQRISLARAFLKDAPILLLDEPSSALDAKNSENLKKIIFTLCKNKTVIMVTHDPNMINENAIVVKLNGGEEDEK